MVKRLHHNFIFKPTAFRRAHASTVCAVEDTLVCAWFAGYREGHESVNIWLSIFSDGAWTLPRCVASDRQYACWNPVLFKMPDGPLHLFYKVGDSPAGWTGFVTSSRDGGGTWCKPLQLPDGIIGPDRNKPLLLDNGTLLCGSSTEGPGVYAKFPTTDWRIHFERLLVDGNWQRTNDIDTGDRQLLQPTLYATDSGDVHALCRSQHGYLFSLQSADLGITWSQPQEASLKNPNSACEVMTLEDGRHLLALNDSTDRRYPLNVAIADNSGEFGPSLPIEDELGSYEYPSVCQSPDGLIHITYSWNKRQIAHTTLEV